MSGAYLVCVYIYSDMCVYLTSPQHPLPSILVPAHSPDSVYPLPWAVFRLYSLTDMLCTVPDTSLPSPTSIDRYLVEDAVTAILASHQGNRKEW